MFDSYCIKNVKYTFIADVNTASGQSPTLPNLWIAPDYTGNLWAKAGTGGNAPANTVITPANVEPLFLSLIQMRYKKGMRISASKIEQAITPRVLQYELSATAAPSASTVVTSSQPGQWIAISSGDGVSVPHIGLACVCDAPQTTNAGLCNVTIKAYATYTVEFRSSK
jgi:hypothetical protein